MAQSNATIEAINLAIAEFMGLEKDHHAYLTGGRFRTEYLVNGYWLPLRKLKYHTSWDWLMPCWKKAGKILFDIRGDLIGENYLDAYRITKAFIDACRKVEIENAHDAIYNAIQLISGYNQQKQTNGQNNGENKG